MENKPIKIVYVTPALYMAGGVERVLTLKANYFAEHFGYDITIILTEGKGKPLFYPLNENIKVINLDINFEELWHCSFIEKVCLYLRKQRWYKKLLTAELMRLRPDITVSLLRREINFLNEINDGSKKIGEMHINRANYRNFEANESNIVKDLFAKFWMRNLVKKLKRLDHFVVLTEEDKKAWPELQNIRVVPDPLSFCPTKKSLLKDKRVIAVGRYVYQKGFDMLLQAWSRIEKQYPDWQLAVYGDGERTSYEQLMEDLGIDAARCHLNGPTSDIQSEYVNSSLFVFSSRFEGFGMVLVEAMACGLPVVSFACPCGPRDIIKDGYDGLLVENGNVEALTNSLSMLMNDETLRFSMSQEGQKNVQRFRMEQVAQQWNAVFKLNKFQS
ncbi:MAG: glycosyltransferase family 4 protein [Prevotella sp.]|nr:glycosyltransferase family 4 protein [Prevotella sp.]